MTDICTPEVLAFTDYVQEVSDFCAMGHPFRFDIEWAIVGMSPGMMLFSALCGFAMFLPAMVVATRK